MIIANIAPSVSVVVSVRNDRAFVRDCLDSLCGAGNGSILEIIVVDRGSTDGTPSVAEAVGGAVRVVRLPPGASEAAAVAAGRSEAAGDSVAVLPVRAIYAPGALRDGTPPILHVTGTTAFGRAAAAMEPRPPLAPLPRSWRFMPDTPVAQLRHALARPQGRAALLPAAAAAGIALARPLRRRWLAAIVPLGHAAVTAGRALHAARDPGVAPHRAFLAGEIRDWGRGAAWWARWAVAPARGRP